MTRRLPVLVALLAVLLPGVALVAGDDRAAAVPTGAGRYVWSETVDRGDTFRLVLGNASGQVEQVLAPHVYGRAAFSPDGTRLAFAAPNGSPSLGRWALTVVNTDGTGLRRVTAPLVGDFDPWWAPDGSAVVVSRDERGCFEAFCRVLWVIGLNGQGDRRLDSTTGGRQPTWSPDGGQIAYAAPEGIRAVAVAGGASRVVAQGALSWPAFSPDGRSLAAVRRVAAEAGTISVVSQAGGALTDTAAGNGGGLPEAPVWGDDRTLVHLNAWGQGENGRTRAEVRHTVLGGDTSVVFQPARPIFAVHWTQGWRAGLPQAAARAADDACPPEQIGEDGFTDVPQDNVHETAVDCVVHWGVASGRSTTRYEPGTAVTREQMATFLAGVVERSGGTLPEPTRNRFSDDDGSVHERSVDRLAEAGIVQGTGGSTYAPAAPVTRAQMAAFLVRTYDYRAQQAGRPALPPGEDWFYDDQTSTLHALINAAAQAGFTGGTGDGRYQPAGTVRRDQMASFVARVLDLLVEQGVAEVPPAA